MNRAARKPKRAGREPTIAPHPKDAEHVRHAFEQDAKHPERRETVSAEELRRWAESGEWPESSD